MAGDRVGLVVLANADKPVARPVENEVCEPPLAVLGERLGRQRGRDSVEAASRKVRYDDEVARNQVRRAAVFLYTRPDIEAFRRESGDGSVEVAPD